MNIVEILSSQFNLKKYQVENAIELIDEGNTIPFIARYRKEKTGEMSDTVLREFDEKLKYLRNLSDRKDDIIRLIDEQGKLTDDIVKALENAKTLQEAEDIYAPYKKKKRTRAIIAKEKGLDGLADIILNSNEDIEKKALDFVNIEKEVTNEKEAIDGAKDIIAEIMSDDANIRKFIREDSLKRASIVTKAKKEEDSVYKMYYEFSEKVKTILPHRILAINRGEKEEFLAVKIEMDDEKYIDYMVGLYTSKKNSNNRELIREIAIDSYKRLIYPSMDREIRNTLTEIAQERAIEVFGKNLNGLLLQPPIRDCVVMGFDPAYRTGCKIAVVDKNGKLLDYTTVYPTKPQDDIVGAKKELKKLIKKYGVNIISIGNGTASRESEKFVADMISEIHSEDGIEVSYTIVNEAGASVYSASKLANEEHPDINVSIRGAISIARRLQDPLAELVKIDPKSIGVGQYQHDVNEKRLGSVLDGVVEDTVNKIGVDVNTASYSLLSHIAGISSSVAKNIVAYRDENGDFVDINEIKKVKRLGPAAFEQCAGFLRIPNAKNPLDNTGVHPESYKACGIILDSLGYEWGDDLSDIDERIRKEGIENLIEKAGIGLATFKDIIEEIKKPGRDIRDSGVKPVLRTDVVKIEDLKEGMELTGTVRNVVDFGAFVDIGIKNDGLVHISKISKKRIKNPSDVLTVGDIVKVTVIGIDMEKGKVSLSMI